MKPLGLVNSLEVAGDYLYIGGAFDDIGGIPAKCIVRYNGGFSNLGSTGLASSTSFQVYTMLAVGNDLFVGGDFQTAGGVTVNGISRWDGVAWWALGSGVSGGSKPMVLSMAMVQTELYVGGRFVNAGGSTVNNLAKWNGESFYPIGNGMNDDLLAMSYNEPFLYFGGKFTNSNGGAITNKIGQFGGCFVQPPSPCTYSNLGSGTVTKQIYAVTFFQGQLYAVGNFLSIGGVAANYIARWNGLNWRALGSGLENQATTLAVFQNQLYVGGYFLTAGGVPAKFVAKWSGSAWSAMPVELSTTGYVQVLKTIGDFLYIGGLGFSVSGSKNIVAFNGSVKKKTSEVPSFFSKHLHHFVLMIVLGLSTSDKWN